MLAATKSVYDHVNPQRTTPQTPPSDEHDAEHGSGGRMPYSAPEGVGDVGCACCDDRGCSECRGDMFPPSAIDCT